MPDFPSSCPLLLFLLFLLHVPRSATAFARAAIPRCHDRLRIRQSPRCVRRGRRPSEMCRYRVRNRRKDGNSATEVFLLSLLPFLFLLRRRVSRERVASSETRRLPRISFPFLLLLLLFLLLHFLFRRPREKDDGSGFAERRNPWRGHLRPLCRSSNRGCRWPSDSSDNNRDRCCDPLWGSREVGRK